MRDCSLQDRAALAEVGGDGPAAQKLAAPSTAAHAGVDETLEVQLHHPGVIDRFQLREQLGSGGFGTVWKALDQDLDRLVAIKVPRAGATDDTQAKRFLQEARAASQLKHPGIVSVHEVGRYRDGMFIVSDYIEGQTLAEWLQQRQRSPQEAATLCRSLAQAIHYAHEAGVVHRDLKPSNILVDAQQQPHVTDFGLARRVADESKLTADGLILGTPAYMSPEQMRGNRERVDHRIDIYALGVILFEMLTGELPFRGSVQMLIHQVLASDAPRPRSLSSDVPRDLENICLKCLEKDPRRRYQDAAALAEDLDRFLADEPVAARPIPSSVRAWRWCKRNRVASSLTAFLLVMLLSGVMATTSQWMRAEAAAAREAQTRAELEFLTQQILELAGRLQQLEERQPPDSMVLATPPAAPRDDKTVNLSHSFSAPTEALALAGRPSQTEKTRHRTWFSAAAVPTDGRREPRSGKLGRGRGGSAVPQANVQRGALQADAELTLRQLARISPALAQQCRGVFPGLVGD